MRERIYQNDLLRQILTGKTSSDTGSTSLSTASESSYSGKTSTASDSSFSSGLLDSATEDSTAVKKMSEQGMPEYEHFSFFQNILFVRPRESSSTAQETLQEILESMGQPQLTSPLNERYFSCELLFEPERHQS